MADASSRVPGALIGLSVVVPCYNEDLMIDELVSRLTSTCERIFPGDYEIMLINDGSTDQTWPSICRHVTASSDIVGIDLARNHGHQLALTAGLALSDQMHRLLIGCGYGA